MSGDNEEKGESEYTSTEFDHLPEKVQEKILWSLPFECKLKARTVSKHWKGIVNPQLNFNIPEFNDVTAATLANFSQDIGELTITSLVLPIPSQLRLYNGHKIHLLKFVDPDVTEDNMIWLMTKCYCVREIQIIQKESNEASLKSVLSFLISKSMRVLNMASRTLKILKVIGQNETRQISHLFEHPVIDFIMLKNCTSLQSLFIINMPLLTMKNIPELPLSLGHLAFEVMQTSFRGKKELISLGFIDFSNPVAVETFQFILRLSRLKKITSVPLNGQKLMETCQSMHTFNASWCSETNHYKLQVDTQANAFSQRAE